MEISAFLRNTFDQIVEGILFVDTEGVVLYANAAYLNFLNMSYDQLVGKRLRDFRKHAQLPEVVKSGRRRLHAQRLEELEEAYFVNMYPIYEDGKVVAGLSVITFMDEAQRTRLELNNFEENNKQLLKKINQRSSRFTFEDIIGVSKLTQEAKRFAASLAEGDMTILLEGESGTGKEMYAQSIHNAGPRRNNVFLAVNCASFSKDMLESELFGYTEGAFTGAKKGGKIGLFEAANGGTLFLDEIAEMDISIQAKLLRVLQEHKIRPIGSVREYDVDVRIICACNKKLSDRVKEGLFRDDLYYRLSMFPIRIPALRERREDIAPIAYTILNQYNRKQHKNLVFSDDSLACLEAYDWPGNVRELRNVVEFSVYMARGNTITKDALPDQLRYSAGRFDEQLTLAARVKQFEREEVLRVVARYGNSLEGKKKAAAALGISLASLYNKLKEV